MSITITITDPTPAQIAALFGTTGTSNTKVAKEKPKAEKAKVEKTEEPETEDAADDGAPTKEDVTKAAQAYAGKNGRDALKELLEEFKAANISSIDEGDYAKFIEKASA